MRRGWDGLWERGLSLDTELSTTPGQKARWSQPGERWGEGDRAKGAGCCGRVGIWRRMVRSWDPAFSGSLDFFRSVQPIYGISEIWHVPVSCLCYMLCLTWSADFKLDKWLPWICCCSMCKSKIERKLRSQKRWEYCYSDLAEVNSQDHVWTCFHAAVEFPTHLLRKIHQTHTALTCCWWLFLLTFD